MPKKKKLPPRVQRDEVDSAALINALQQHILGEREMTPPQVTAALALLKLKQIIMAGDADIAHEDALKELE